MASLAHILVGTAFEEPTPRAVLRLSLDLQTGALATSAPPLTLPAGPPGWLEPSRVADGLVYVAFEDDPGTAQGFALTAERALEPVGARVSTVGRAPCYLALDATGRWLFAANYVEGSVAVLPVARGGGLGAATDSKKHQGGELVAAELSDRQEAAHCHCVAPHPSNRWVAVADLGLSRVFVYAFDAARGALVGAADDARHLALDASAGPRHVAWADAGATLYVCNELDGTVTACSFDARTGALEARRSVSALPAGDAPNRAPHRGNSDIAVHPNGRFLYVGVRSTEPCGSIAVFAIRRGGDGFPDLELVGHESTRGAVPRNFKLCGANATWLVVGNQESRDVASFAVDAESGRLRYASSVKTPHKPCNISVHPASARVALPLQGPYTKSPAAH